jgi:hypothetical protein
VNACGRARQASLDALLKTLERGEGSPYYSYAALVRYLASGEVRLNGAEAATLHSVAASLHRRAAGTPVYLAGGRAYTGEGLAARRPKPSEARPEVFFESPVHPGIWLEKGSRRAAALHRELGAVALHCELSAVAHKHGPAVLGVVRGLMGLSGAAVP